MDCEAYRILISGYIDGELSEQEMQMLKVHLQTCEACAGYLQKLESMQTALKRYTLFQDMPEIPSNFAGRVTEQLQDIIEEKQSSFGNTLRTRYRTWVIELAERWAGSLKTRPFAWTA
jgi:anti-sigma factor RsiW